MATKRKAGLTVIFGLGSMYVIIHTHLCVELPADPNISICVVTILRIVIAARFDINDFTYDLAKLAICTDLEPMLGMITASLPVMQPALRRIMGLRTEQSSEGRPSSSVARLRTKSTKKSSFRQLKDSYTLTDIGTSETHVGVSSKPSLSEGDEETYFAELGTEPRPFIKVRRDWEVSTGL